MINALICSGKINLSEWESLAQKLLSNYPDIMLLADRGFANHQLINWLQNSSWHYCLRLPCDVIIHGARRHPIELKYLTPNKAEAIFYQNIGLWLDGKYRCNIKTLVYGWMENTVVILFWQMLKE